MPLGKVSLRRVTGRAWAPVFAALALAGCAENYPQTTLLPRGDFARLLHDVFQTTVWWALVVFVLVEGLLLFAIFRYRGRPGDAEPEQTHGNTTLEIVWTAIPAFILAMIAVPTVKTIFATYEDPGPEALHIDVIGHQWWWEFRYPEYGIVTAGELHVPVGRTVRLNMSAADVLHSFWVPQFAAKRDVFPNRPTHLWFKAEVAGNFPGQCAEFCGIQHGRMAHRIVAHEPAEFEAWVAKMRRPRPAPTDTATPPAAGIDSAQLATARKVLPTCAGCHAFSATDTTRGRIGPNLADVGSRSFIAAGWLENTDENLARWLRTPQAVKEGVLMPNLGLTDEQVTALVAYLRAYHQ
ncbi:MAG TPA: cytochrome c oxidase subunit II [Gemmatimonadales bacterium]|nr:cytochrome c oxidase subunit II [Gemmatimonadales bacterium]